MSNNIKYYLAAYNLVAFTFWLAYLCNFIANHFTLSPTGLLLLNIAQGLAVLEIIHALLKWVKSPVASTAAQVASRILVLVLINIFIKNESLVSVTSKGAIICSLAWGVTELIRYSFYLLSLFNRQPSFLLWMRYTFFIVLYPIGVTGEWFILAGPVAIHAGSSKTYIVFLSIMAIIYVYYFTVLYK